MNQTATEKDNLLVKKDSLYVFILLSLMSSPTYSMRIIPLSELKRFSMAFELERVDSANPWKECGRKPNLATGKMRQSDNLNVL